MKAVHYLLPAILILVFNSSCVDLGDDWMKTEVQPDTLVTALAPARWMAKEEAIDSNNNDLDDAKEWKNKADSTTFLYCFFDDGRGFRRQYKVGADTDINIRWTASQQTRKLYVTDVGDTGENSFYDIIFVSDKQLSISTDIKKMSGPKRWVKFQK